MKTLHDYLLGVRKEQKIKVRFACVLNDEMISKIENAFKKYDLISMGSPKKTIFQTQAIGFENPVNSEVTIIDATLGLPFSPSVLRLEVARSIKVSETKVAIDDSFTEAATTIQHPSQPEKEIETYVGKQKQIGPVEATLDHKQYFGSDYNEDMVKTIEDSRKEIKSEINKVADK